MGPNNIQQIDQQQAWQTAFQLRTCPDDTTLRAAIPDENLQRHLVYCSICREKRTMPPEQLSAWQGLFDKFAPLIHQAANNPQPGQVWVLKKKLSRWGDDGYYYSPPNVLLLEMLDEKKGFRVAQLYFDKRLMGEGDVWLGDRFGFAQGWNSYVIYQDALECWLGNAAESQVAEVIHAGTLTCSSVEEHSVLSFFRKVEATVGTFVSGPVAALESAENEAFELIPGLKLVVSEAKGFMLEIATGTLDLLQGTFKPAMVLRGGTTKSAVVKLTDEHKKLIQDHCPVIPIEMRIVGDTLTMKLKWLREKPDELPVVKAFYDKLVIFDEKQISISTEKIDLKHPMFSALLMSDIKTLKLRYVENVLSLSIDNKIIENETEKWR